MATIKIIASALRAAIRPVAPLASHDVGAPPVLAAVHLWTGDGVLYAACTDRIAAGITRTQVDGLEAGFEACVDVAEFGRLLELVAHDRNPRLHVEATPGGLTVLAEPYESTQPSATFHLQATCPPASFPDLVALIGNRLDHVQPVTATGLTSKALARFAAVDQPDSPLQFTHTGPLKPIIVSCGDWFVGLVMPARLTDANGLRIDDLGVHLWPDLFGTPLAPAEPARADA